MSRTLIVLLFAGLNTMLSHGAAVAWNKDGLYTSRETVLPGKQFRLCETMGPMRKIDWKFSSSAPLTFLLVHPTQTDGIYHIREFDILKLEGSFTWPMAREWCWVWANESKSDLVVTIEMTRR